MNIKIDLSYNPIIKLAGEPIVLPAIDPIILEVGSTTYENLTLRAFVRCNGKTRQFSVLPNAPIDITDLLSAGVLEVAIKSLVNGKVVKSWEAQPLRVEEINGDFRLYDLYKTLDKRITALEKSHEIIL